MRERIAFPRFDAEFNTDVCDAYNNAELELRMRIGFRRIEPAGGAAEGTYHDYGEAASRLRKIIRWTPNAWSAWKQQFLQSAQSYWHGKFWLINDSASFEYRSRSNFVLYPNVWCRFKLQGFDAPAAGLHHTIDVVRLHASESWFGSHATLYDSKDTSLIRKATTSTKQPVLQRAHVHEIGHLLGLNHVDVGKAHCPAAGNTNAAACYGVADSDMQSVMGSGMELKLEHAFPWRESLRQLAAQAMIAKGPRLGPALPMNLAQLLVPIMMLNSVWPAATARHYPRTLSELNAGQLLRTRPNRLH